MPLSRTPTLILSGTSTRAKKAGWKRSSTRRSLVAGRRGGFPRPVPSSVPTGSLETKSIKYAAVTYDLLSGGATTHVNNVAQGTANADRLGYKMRNTALHIKGQFSVANTGPYMGICGYFLVWDKSPNTALALPSDIFNINAGAGYDLGNTFPLDRDRFVVLKSMRRKVTQDPRAGLNQHLVDDYVPLPKYCVTSFTKGNGSGAIANTQTGALLFIPWRTVTIAGTGDDKVAGVFTNELYFAEA